MIKLICDYCKKEITKEQQFYYNRKTDKHYHKKCYEKEIFNASKITK